MSELTFAVVGREEEGLGPSEEQLELFADALGVTDDEDDDDEATMGDEPGGEEADE